MNISLQLREGEGTSERPKETEVEHEDAPDNLSNDARAVGRGSVVASV
jgi:hypothetical protein